MKNVFFAACIATLASTAAYADMRGDAKWAIDQAAGQLPSEVGNALSTGSACLIDSADERDLALLAGASAVGGTLGFVKAAKKVARGNARGCLKAQGAAWVVDVLDQYDPSTQAYNAITGVLGW